MSSSTPTDRNTKNALEWVVFGLSCLLVATAVGILALQALHHDDDPADLRTSVGQSSIKEGLITIPITVENQGSRTASEVQIAVEAQFASGARSAELLFDFVPRGSRREGFVVFPGEGPPTAVTPRVSGYVEP